MSPTEDLENAVILHVPLNSTDIILPRRFQVHVVRGIIILPKYPELEIYGNDKAPGLIRYGTIRYRRWAAAMLFVRIIAAP